MYRIMMMMMIMMFTQYCGASCPISLLQTKFGVRNMRAVMLHICHNKVSFCSEILPCFLFPFSYHHPLPAMFLLLENNQIPCDALLFDDYVYPVIP
jgi:hypothetical protein